MTDDVVLGRDELGPCTAGPSGKHQLDTSMEAGPCNCFFCGKSLKGMRYESYNWDEDLVESNDIAARLNAAEAENAALREVVKDIDRYMLVISSAVRRVDSEHSEAIHVLLDRIAKMEARTDD